MGTASWEGIRMGENLHRKLIKMTFQQDRREGRPDAYSVGYIEGLSEARTMLEGFFNSR